MKTVIEQIREQMADMAMEELIRIHNYGNDAGDMVISLTPDEVETYFATVWDAVRAFTYGDANMNDDYFTFDGNANVVTFNYIDDPACPIDIGYTADWLADNEQLWSDFGIEVEIETEYEPLSFFETFYLDLDFNYKPFIDEIISEYSGSITINADGEYVVDGDEDDHVTYTADDLLADYAEYIDEDKLLNLINLYWDLDLVNAREESGTFYVL